MRLVRLTQDHTIKPFDCENADLNGFLFDDAKNYQKELMAVTYILENDDITLAYFTYQNDKISYQDFNGNRDKFLQRISAAYLPLEKGHHRSCPAVKIGRLAVDKSQKGHGLGRKIIQFTKRYFTENNKTGCKFITVDAYRESLGFYEKIGFNYLTSRDRKSDTRLMYYNLEKLD